MVENCAFLLKIDLQGPGFFLKFSSIEQTRKKNTIIWGIMVIFGNVPKTLQ